MVAVGEAAELQVLLTLKDQLSPGLAAASSKIGALSGAGGLGGLSGAAAKVEGALGRVGGALSTAGAKISGLLTGPVGLLGLTAGFGLLAAGIKKGIDSAEGMAKAIEILAPLTGDTAEQTSALLAVFDRYGITADTATTRLAFMEKAVGLLTVTTAKATAFQKEFGFSLTDASGKVKDANTLLLNAADYWNSDASATQKAALESKLFGRGFADMIPILNLGSQGIKDAEAAATSLGLTLTATNVQDLQRFQEATRKAGEAVSGLELQIGLALVPALTDLATSMASFVRDNKDNIVGFFRDAVKFGQQLAGVITGSVVPVLKTIVGWWNDLPGPLKDLLVAGFVTGKVTKFLFDIGPLDIGKALLGPLANTFLGRGSPTNPMFVVDVNGAGGVAGAAGGIAGLSVAGLSAIVAGGIALYFVNQDKVNSALATVNAGLTAQGKAPLNSKYDSNLFDIGNHLQAIADALTGNAGSYFSYPKGNGTVMKGPNLSGVGPTDASGAGTLDYVKSDALSLAAALEKATTWAGHWTKQLQDVEKATHNAFLRGTKDKNLASDAETLTKYFESVSSTYFAKSGTGNLSKDITRLLADANAARKSGNTTLANKLDADATRLQAIKDKLATANSDLATANAKLAALNNKPTTFTTYVDVTTDISIRSQQTQNFRSNLWGRSHAE